MQICTLENSMPNNFESTQVLGGWSISSHLLLLVFHSYVWLCLLLRSQKQNPTIKTRTLSKRTSMGAATTATTRAKILAVGEPPTLNSQREPSKRATSQKCKAKPTNQIDHNTKRTQKQMETSNTTKTTSNCESAKEEKHNSLTPKHPEMSGTLGMWGTYQQGEKQQNNKYQKRKMYQ